MVSESVKAQARKVWQEYGDTIVKAFDFPKGAFISANGVEELLKKGSDDSVMAFIDFIAGQTIELGNAKFVGES